MLMVCIFDGNYTFLSIPDFFMDTIYHFDLSMLMVAFYLVLFINWYKMLIMIILFKRMDIVKIVVWLKQSAFFFNAKLIKIK